MERQRIEIRGRGRPRAAATDDAILAAAVACIRDVGYDNVTMDGIAERAGVGKATLYRRWKSREPLVIEAISRIVRAVPVPDTGTLRGDLRRLMRSASTMYEDPATRHLLSGLIAAMARNPAIARAVRGGFVSAWRKAMHRIIARAAERGELQRGVSPDLANEMLHGPLLHHFLIGGERVDERYTRRVVDAVLRGLEA